ncbi:phosphatidylinositol-4-phosphate 5-kinase [Pelagophyceae sp. CCMP2097]|nr:phosphatidylinositol-4-phosphate 5-kinase [Pelagophyceae sp. CCMP2097]
MASEAGSTSKFLVGGVEVAAILDAEYAKIRARFGLADDFLSAFDFEKMEQGGGKGGQVMGFTKEYLYIIKELNASDHATLLKIAGDYATHILGADGSLLARFFLHFEHKGKRFTVMNNWMPPPNYEKATDLKLSFDLQKNYSQYDLKGCADDKTLKLKGKKIEAVHKRIFNIKLWLGETFWTAERRHYFLGKVHAKRTTFPVSKEDYAQIMKQVKRDVEFLQDKGLMDYSLVVAMHALPKTADNVADLVYRGTSDGGAQPYIGTSANQICVVYVGIIDFLQNWTAAKEIANKIKCLETNKATIQPVPYGDRFKKYLASKFEPSCQ